MSDLLKKFIDFAVGNIVVLILGLISTPIITNLISPNEIGKYSTFSIVTNFLLIFVLVGLDQSYLRFYYDENEENKGQLLRRVMLIPLLLSIVVGIVSLIFYRPISTVIVGDENVYVSIALVIYLVFSVISKFTLLQLRLKQKGKLYSLMSVIQKLIYLILVVLIFVKFKDNYMTLIVAITLSTCIFTFITIFISRKELFAQRNTSVNSSIKTRDLIKFGGPFIFSMAVIWIFQSIDVFSIKLFAGYGELGIYTGAMTIVGMLNICQAAFTTFWVPVANEKYKNNPEDREFFQNINGMVVVVMLLLAIALILSKDIIILMLGNKYRTAVFIFPFLVFMPIMYTISETTMIGINFAKKSKDHLLVAVVSAVANIIGNLILVPTLGAKGAAISTGLAYGVFFLVRTLRSNKYYYIDYKLKRFLVCIMATYILAIYSSFNSFNIVVLILGIAATTIIIVTYKKAVKDLINMLMNVFNN